MRKHVDELKDYIFNNLKDGYTFSKRYSDIAMDLKITQQEARNAMRSIVKEGVIEVVTPPSKGIASNPLYKIRTHKVHATEINPITQYEDGVKVVEFQGVNINLIQLNGYYCIELSDLAMCVLENANTLDKIIKSNPELFEGHIFEVDQKRYVSRQGTITMLLKINLDKALPLRRSLLAEFQSCVVSVMCDSQLRARLYISDDNRVKIQSNINCLLDLDSNQVEEMLVDLEYQVSKSIEGFSTKLIQQDRQIHKLEKKTEQLSNKAENEKLAKERLISESQELRAKLLERQ